MSQRRHRFQIAVLFFIISSALFAQDESPGLIIQMDEAMHYGVYVLSGDSAWDRFHIRSVQAEMSYRTLLPEREHQYAILTLGFRRPVSSVIRQLDGVNIELDAGGDLLHFAGGYVYWGYGREWQWGDVTCTLNFGPSVDGYYTESKYLVALGIDGGIEWDMSLSESVYTGLNLAVGFDFWGKHNIGDPARYSGAVQSGVNAEVGTFIGFRL